MPEESALTGLTPTITPCIYWPPARRKMPTPRRETFVEKNRFKGNCYKAANWICTGQTKGTAKKGHLHVKHGNIKHVYLYPLRKDFRKENSGDVRAQHA